MQPFSISEASTSMRGSFAASGDRPAPAAGTAGVERDDAKILLQVGHNASADPAVQARRAAMQQHDRLALAAVNVVDLHAIELGILAIVGGKRLGRREA